MCTMKRECEDTARRGPSSGQQERPLKKPTLLTPSWTSSFQEHDKINLYQVTQSVEFCYGRAGKPIQHLHKATQPASKGFSMESNKYMCYEEKTWHIGKENYNKQEEVRSR